MNKYMKIRYQTARAKYQMIWKHWRIINELLVRFGQDICRPIAPKCRACPIIELCPSSKQSK